MMLIPKWLWLEETRSNARHRRDGEDGPENPKGPSPSLPSSSGGPGPPPPPPPKPVKPPKTVSVTLTTTMTMTSTTSSSSISTTSSIATTSALLVSSSSLATSTSQSPAPQSPTSSSALINSSPPNVATTSRQEPTTPSTSQPASSTSLTAQVISSSFTTTLPESVAFPLTMIIPSTPSSLFISATDITPTLQPSNPATSTEGNRNIPATSSSSSSLTFLPTASPAGQPISPEESRISSSSPDKISGTHNTPSAGALVLIGVGVGASVAIIISLILLFCRRRTIKKQRELAASYNVPRPSNKRMTWSSQPSEDVKRGYIPSIVFESSQGQSQAQNHSPASQSQSVFSSSNLRWNETSDLASRAHLFTAGGRFIPQAQPQNTMGAGLQRKMSSATWVSQRSQFQEPMTVYEDQLPAFAARLKELGIVGGNGNATSGTNSSVGSSSTVGGYAPQLQLPQLDLGPRIGDSREDSYGWLGSTTTSTMIGSQVLSDYTISPIEQRQTPIQTQQSPWQIQLPIIEEARRGSQTSSHIDGIYELSGDGVQQYPYDDKAWNVSGGERVMSSRAGSGEVSKWKDPLERAREQRLR